MNDFKQAIHQEIQDLEKEIKKLQEAEDKCMVGLSFIFISLSLLVIFKVT